MSSVAHRHRRPPSALSQSGRSFLSRLVVVAVLAVLLSAICPGLAEAAPIPTGTFAGKTHQNRNISLKAGHNRFWDLLGSAALTCRSGRRISFIFWSTRSHPINGRFFQLHGFGRTSSGSRFDYLIRGWFYRLDTVRGIRWRLDGQIHHIQEWKTGDYCHVDYIPFTIWQR